MKGIVILLLAFVMPFLGQSQKKQLLLEDTKKAINLSFEKYRQALTDEKWEAAAQWLDKGTSDYYKNLLGWIRFADSTQVQSLPVADKFSVLVVRQRIPRGQIATLDARGLFVYLSQIGLTGKKQFIQNTIGNINVKGNTATAQLFVTGKPQPFFIQFNDENGWKINLGVIFTDTQTAMMQMAEKKQLSETKFVLNTIKWDATKESDAAIWKPTN